MNENLVTVVIPVYNAEKYLKKCIKSVMQQSYQKLEIILINDGSKDNSGKIMKHFEKMDSRIKLINQENSGVSKARNIGIDASTGKYICFIDADDYVKQDYIKELYNKISGCELSICGYKRTKNTEKNILLKMEGLISEVDLYHYTFASNLISCGCWNKMFCLDIILLNKIYFNEDIFIGEDALFLSNYYKFCTKTYYIKKCLYIYQYNVQSALNGGNVKKSIDYKKISSLSTAKLLRCDNSEKGDDINIFIVYRCVRLYLWLMYQMTILGNYDDIYINKIVNSLKLDYKFYRKSNCGTILERISVLALIIVPKKVLLFLIRYLNIFNKKVLYRYVKREN